MKRIPEPELMLAKEQAIAYADADFESAHSLYPKLFDMLFPDRPRRALVLDVGCGPCDVTRRFARANPCYRFHGVDGSAAMLRRAPKTNRIKLIVARIPGAKLPSKAYDVILSSSLLHHLPDPRALWQTVNQYSKPGTIVFVVDLRRPTTRAAAQSLVEKYSTEEPEVLKRDFFHSLLAAFTQAEVRRQLRTAHLDWLTVTTISDRHLMITGRRPR